MPSLIESLGLGTSGAGKGAVNPNAFLPVGSVAKSIRGGNVASVPTASAPSPGPQGAPSAATQGMNLQTIIAGDDPKAEPGRFGMDPTTKDSMLLGLAAGLQSGGLEGGAAGALMGFARASAVKRGRPEREAAKGRALEDRARKHALELRGATTAESEAATKAFGAQTGRGELILGQEELAQRTLDDERTRALNELEFGLKSARTPIELDALSTSAQASKTDFLEVYEAAQIAFPDDLEAQKNMMQDAMAFRKAGAKTVTTIQEKGQSALEIERNRLRAGREGATIERIQLAGGVAAHNRIQDLEKLRFTAPMVISGPAAEGRAYMAIAASWLGLDTTANELIGDVPSAEIMKAANTNLAVNALKQVFTGATSNFELKELKGTIPGLATTPEGNALLAEMGLRAEENKIALSQELDNYLNEFDGDLRPKGEQSWADVENQFFAANPILTPEIKTRMLGVRNAGFRSMEQEQRVTATIGALDAGTLSADTAVTSPINAEDVSMLSFNDLKQIVGNVQYRERLSPEVQRTIINEVQRRSEGLR